MENWGWSEGKSADELADYMAFALQILKNAGLPCEGITTPGGFGNRAARRPGAGDAPGRAGTSSTPRSRTTSGTSSPTRAQRGPAGRVRRRARHGRTRECVVSIIGCTGDWFGGWDGLDPRLGRPVHHRGPQGRPAAARSSRRASRRSWSATGRASTSTARSVGFKIFQEVVRRLHAPLRPPDLDEAQRDRPLLGRQGTDPNRQDGDGAGVQGPVRLPGVHGAAGGAAGGRYQGSGEREADGASPRWRSRSI